MNGDWVSGTHETVEAEVLNLTAVDCQIPAWNNTGMEVIHFMTDAEPYARWQMKAGILCAIKKPFEKVIFQAL